MEIIRVGVDLAKNVFQVHGVNAREQAVWQRSLKRNRWVGELTKRVEPGAEVGMEACAGAHHWARLLTERGYRVKLMAPQFVKPYVKSNKTDRNDAEAICEAMSRPSMRFVKKSTDKSDDWGSWAQAEAWRKQSFAARTSAQRLQWLKGALRLHYQAREAGSQREEPNLD